MLIADDEALVRHALRVFVDADELLEIVGEARDGAEAVALCASLRPDVVLMDLQMPVLGGVNAIAEAIRMQPELKALALTTFSSERHVVSALRAGAAGYLVKDTSPDEIVAAIKDVQAGQSVLSARVTRELIGAVRNGSEADGRLILEGGQTLTERELASVRLLARGMSNAEIARELHISEATVKSNLGRIMTKWEVRDRVQVLIRAVRLGLVSI